MKYIMLILFLFISCNTITTKYIMYPKDGKIEWYINLQPKQYKNIILRID